MDKRWRRGLAGTSLVLLGLLLATYWPAVLGGATTYVTTRGSSMEPLFNQGDLALVKAADSYAIGDVVAYRSATLGGTTVLHRIKGGDAGGFTTQGDNNTFLDPDNPTAEDLIGKLAVRLPFGGRLLPALRLGIPLLATGLSLLGVGRAKSRRTRRRPAHLAPPAPRPAPPASAIRSWRTATIALGATGAGCLALGLVSFSRPASRAGTTQVTYTQRGTFAYGAEVEAGAVYADGRVDTGDAVFLKLVDGLDLVFDYDFEAGAAHTIEGTLAVRAELSNPSGWRHVLELQPPTPFRDDDVRAEVRLDIRQVEALAAEVAASTGIAGSSTTVTIVPEAEVTGTLDGNALAESFRPELRFDLQPLQLRLAAPAQEEGEAAVDPLAPVTAGMVERTTQSPVELAAFGVAVPVSAARAVSVGLGAPALLGAAAGLLVLRRRLQGEDARIELRHGHRMVPVSGAGSETDAIEVRSIEDLARMAEQYQGLILNRETPRGHHYVLQVDGVAYRYSSET